VVDIDSPGFNSVAAATTAFASLVLPPVGKRQQPPVDASSEVLLKAIEGSASRLTAGDVKAVLNRKAQTSPVAAAARAPPTLVGVQESSVVTPRCTPF
jgi:hypothetical protein